MFTLIKHIILTESGRSQFKPLKCTTSTPVTFIGEYPPSNSTQSCSLVFWGYPLKLPWSLNSVFPGLFCQSTYPRQTGRKHLPSDHVTWNAFPMQIMRPTNQATLKSKQGKAPSTEYQTKKILPWTKSDLKASVGASLNLTHLGPRMTNNFHLTISYLIKGNCSENKIVITTSVHKTGLDNLKSAICKLWWPTGVHQILVCWHLQWSNCTPDKWNVTCVTQLPGEYTNTEINLIFTWITRAPSNLRTIFTKLVYRERGDRQH